MLAGSGRRPSACCSTSPRAVFKGGFIIE